MSATAANATIKMMSGGNGYLIPRRHVEIKNGIFSIAVSDLGAPRLVVQEKKATVRTSGWIVALFVCTSTWAVGQSCSGDCQPGVIAGPFTAAQIAEYTATNFSQCMGSLCATAPWSGNQIEGIDAQENIGTEYQFFDQVLNLDDNIAVGPTVSGENAQVLQWVNGGALQAFDKATGQAIYGSGTVALPSNAISLWSASTQAECSGDSGNVQVIYDRLDNVFVIQRRVAYTLSGINHYAWCIATSSRSDLTSTSWYAYEYKMDSVIPCLPSSNNCSTGSYYYYFPDWPRIGTWSNGFYSTFDLTDPTSAYSPVGFEACQLDRSDMVLGQPAKPMTCFTYMVPQNDEPSLIHSADVADIDSVTGPPTDEPEYFLSLVTPSNAQQGSDGQGYCTSKTTPCVSNQLALFTWGASGLVGPTFVTVNLYTPGCYDTANLASETRTSCVPVPTTNPTHLGAYGSPLCGDYQPQTPCLDSLGDRLANRLAYNNLVSSGSQATGTYLTASHVVMESSSDERTGIRYYILQVSNGVATVLVNSGGSSGPPDLQDPNGILFYFMPSAVLDNDGNLAIVYTTSGADCSSCQNQYNPAIDLDVLPWSVSTFDPPTLIVQGSGDEENTTHWGEYAAMVIDPTDNLTFYGIGEYFNTSQTGTASCGVPSSNCYTWQTRIFRGQGPLPALTLAPASLTFGQQAIGTTSSPQAITLTNTGTGALTIASIQMVGANAGDFGQINTCGSQLAPNNNCQISVTFAPITPGTKNAAVSIADDVEGSPQTVGIMGATAVVLAPPEVSFPNQYVGTSGASRTVTLTNTTLSTLTITGVTASPADFAARNECGGSIASGSSCTVSIIFTPTASGTRNGVLMVADNATDAPQTAALTGVGQDFAMAPSGSAQATVSPGQTANYAVTITPGGGFNKSVALSCSGMPPQSSCSVSPSSVALRGSAPVSVNISVATTGTAESLAQPRAFPSPRQTAMLGLALPAFSGLVLLLQPAGCFRQQGRLRRLVLLCLFSLAITFCGCGGGSSMGNSTNATPAGSYNLTVTGTFISGSTMLTHSTKLTLVVQ
jgi:Abnormal spindle-like microcephaly-assoc'd, ASPM-SPD-2-Hydin